jgi:O-antigen/teichoic acid export membrane protein
MKITNKDLYWSYVAYFLKIGASVLLLPFILRMMSPEMVGIWTIFMTITVFTTLLDFGFSFSFARNITYIFSGVRSLKIKGYETVIEKESLADYGLLKGVIAAMQWFYFRIAIVLFLLLITLGTYYIYIVLQKYKSDHLEVYVSWVLFCILSTYSLYTLYYDSLLQGKGLIKKSKQIMIIGQIVYLIIAAILIMAGKGLLAIVFAQAASIITIRWMSYHSFFTPEIKHKLYTATAHPKNEIIKAIYPNAIKIGLTSLGSFMVQRSAIVIGSFYLSLKDIASFGITLQIISIIIGLSGTYIATYLPKIVQSRVMQNNQAIKEFYLKGQIMLLLTYIIGGLGVLILGEWALEFIGSKTQLIPQLLIFIYIVISFLESNQNIAGTILLSKNEVPFFKASLVAGVTTIILLILMFRYTNTGLWAMIIAPGIAHLYNNWKWPYEVIKQLKISMKDVIKSLTLITRISPNEK